MNLNVLNIWEGRISLCERGMEWGQKDLEGIPSIANIESMQKEDYFHFDEYIHIGNFSKYRPLEANFPKVISQNTDH